MSFSAGQRLRASDLNALDNRGYFSRFTFAVALTSGWTKPALLLAEGAGTGLTYSVIGGSAYVITLGSGTWTAKASVFQGSSTCGLDLTSDGSTPAGANSLTGATTAGAGSVGAGNVSVDLTSDGTTTVTLWAFLGTAGTPSGSRFTLLRTSGPS